MTAARPRPKNWPQLGCRSRFYVYVPAVDRRYLPNAIHTPIYGVFTRPFRFTGAWLIDA
jgi:hypothetical protein